MEYSRWKTPFLKQCFVTLGVSINVAQLALVASFTAILLPQLRRPDSTIPINEASGSWIAAIPEVALVFGNLMVPSIMSKYGRKIANLISIILIFIGWIAIASAQNIIWMLIARFLQGLSLGMRTALGPVMIGEYTSSKNRGAFLTIMSFALAIGALIVHAVGSYLTWQVTAAICVNITFIDLLIVIYSPETPSWLIQQGRYEEGRVAFRWLRGDGEDNELNKMIQADEIVGESKDVDISISLAKKTQNKFAYLCSILKKEEFYKPVFIMYHIHTLEHWAGINILSPFLLDAIYNIVGEEIDVPALVTSIDAQRLFCSVLIVYAIKKFKRRTMLLSMTGLSIIVMLSTAAYTYAREKNVLPVDHPVIGAVLIHLHMVSIASGTVPLPMIISGELFPLQYRSLSSGISSFFFTLQCFLAIKTFSFLVRVLGLYGTYCLYTLIVGYCMVIVWVFLPETKDRTLQDIEEEFKDKRSTTEELQSVQPLMS